MPSSKRKAAQEEAAKHVANIRRQITLDIELAIQHVLKDLGIGKDVMDQFIGNPVAKLRQLHELHPDKGLGERVFRRLDLIAHKRTSCD